MQQSCDLIPYGVTRLGDGTLMDAAVLGIAYFSSQAHVQYIENRSKDSRQEQELTWLTMPSVDLLAIPYSIIRRIATISMPSHRTIALLRQSRVVT